MSKKIVPCIWCREDVSVDAGTKDSALCGKCTSRLADPPQLAAPVKKLTVEEIEAKQAAKAARKTATVKKSTGKGKGWHLKKLFEWEGQFYSFGKPVDTAEAVAIKKLIKQDA